MPPLSFAIISANWKKQIMMALPPPRRNKYFLVLLMVFVTALSFYFFFPTPSLTITGVYGDKEKPLVIIPVSKGTEFTIKYIHSVDRLPVYETFLINDDHNLLLSEVRFIMLGAGMSDSGGQLVYDGKWTIIRNINKEVTSFYLRVSAVGEQTLFINSKVIKLTEITPESGSLKFEIRKGPRLYLRLKGEN